MHGSKSAGFDYEQPGLRAQVTIQLGLRFISAVKTRDFLTADCEIVRTTKSLIFLRGTLFVDSRIAAPADGIWKFF
ncbi:hotdog domain-containing protein [Microvirga rosea]|uniref:hotdog domain-containing protein n=1 Tax=Microvirga rosea TaxID=2715425 RepID=UPI001D0B8ECF|nr:hypothetical protein [Microvirga rosea]